MFTLEPVTLTGRFVRMEPVGPEHVKGLFEAARPPEIWRWFPMKLDSEEGVAGLVARAEAGLAAGLSLSFATRVLSEDLIVGSSSYLNVSPENDRLEIGFTWITPPWQRTAVNTEAKLLMLRHAFQALGCERVELKTDNLNEPSRRAIARLGATEEGALRHHMLRQDGSYRDSVYYSILAEEWPSIERRLSDLLDRSRGHSGEDA